jgi:hypothetical protein
MASFQRTKSSIFTHGNFIESPSTQTTAAKYSCLLHLICTIRRHSPLCLFFTTLNGLLCNLQQKYLPFAKDLNHSHSLLMLELVATDTGTVGNMALFTSVMYKNTTQSWFFLPA